VETTVLYEKYRPKRLSQVVGQAKAVEIIDSKRGTHGLGGQAFWISGKSGQGKSTIAGCIARELADDWGIIRFDAGWLTQADLQRIKSEMHTYSFGNGKYGRAYIIEEAHGLKAAIVRAFLCFTEPVPPHVAFIFTTTNEGQTLFEDNHTDARPLWSRCTRIKLTSQGFAKPAAKLLRGIARREGCNGEPLSYYVRILNENQGNLRAGIQSLPKAL